MENTLYSDFLPEAIAAVFIENGEAFESVFILPSGPQKRTFSKEVIEVAYKKLNALNDTCIIIYINKEGIYDMLPERLFHSTAIKNSNPDSEEMKRDIQLHKEEEDTARKFFSPFESEIYRVKILSQLQLNRIDLHMDYTVILESFSIQWKILQLLTTRQQKLFLYLLPNIHKIKGNYYAIEKILSGLLEADINLALVNEKPQITNKSNQATLGNSRIGDDAMLGICYFSGERCLLVTIQENATDKFKHSSQNVHLVQKLLEFFVPANMDVTVKFEPFIKEKTVLGVNSQENMLSVYTYL